LREIEPRDDVARRKEGDLVAAEGVRDHFVGLGDRADVNHAHGRRLEAIQLAHLRDQRRDVDRFFLRREDRLPHRFFRRSPQEDDRRHAHDRGDEEPPEDDENRATLHACYQ
jgi:hypothetical protein